MVTFKKINDTKFLAENIDELVDKVNILIKDLSGDIDGYNDTTDQLLFDTMYSRLLSSYFIKDESVNFKDLGFVTIKSMVDKKNINVTLGTINDENNNRKYLNGVLYD